MERNKFILPVAIVIGAIILGGCYLVAEIYKQNSLTAIQQTQVEKQKQIDLYNCIAEVDSKWATYIDSVKGTPQASQFWNGITPAQQADINNCREQYK
jgi:hypothetical protein